MQVLFCKNINPNLLYQLTCNKQNSGKKPCYSQNTRINTVFYYHAIVPTKNLCISLAVIRGSRKSVECFAENGKNSPDRTLP